MLSLRTHTHTQQNMTHGPSILYCSLSHESWRSCRRIDGCHSARQVALLPRHRCLPYSKKRRFPRLDLLCWKPLSPILMVAHISQRELLASLWPGVRVHGFFCWLPASGSPASLYTTVCTVPPFPSLPIRKSPFHCFGNELGHLNNYAFSHPTH